MARRGRFTSPNSGGQNLTSLIFNLLRQQKLDEEQAILTAFKNGTPYNGAVLTEADVQSFYDNWASVSGYGVGSTELQNILNKQGEFTNYAIKKQYNSLIAAFNTSNGENYATIIDFLGSRAQDSTDSEDLATYANAVSEVTTAYLKYRGTDLQQGQITAKDYQRLTLEALAVLDPASQDYQDAVYNAMLYEWNAESAKYKNRLAAGKISQGQFDSWANSFAKRVIASGVSADSDLYTSIVASTASGRAGVASNSPAAIRLRDSSADISAILTLASGVGGADLGKMTLEDALAGGDVVLKQLAKNPEAVLLLGDFLDQNPDFVDPTLTRLGITDSQGLLSWLEGTIRRGQDDAAILAASGGKDNTDLWYNVATTNGFATYVDQFAYAGTKWVKDKTNAAGNDVLLSYYNTEWSKYLVGQDSIYGRLPDQFSLGNAAMAAAFNSERQQAIDYLNGKAVKPSSTLTGMMIDGVDEDWGNFELTDANSQAILEGRAVIKYDPKTGTYSTVGPQAGTPATGSYQVIQFVDLNGQMVPMTFSINGTKILDSEGTLIGWRYRLASDSNNDGIPDTIDTDIMGNRLTTPADVGESGDDLVVRDTNTWNPTNQPPAVVNLTPLNVGTGSFDVLNNYEQALALLKNPDGTYTGAFNALSESEKEKAIADIQIIEQRIANIQMRQLSDRTPKEDINGQIELARLDGDKTREDALTWIKNNERFLELDPATGDYRWKPGFENVPGDMGIDPLSGYGGALAVGALGAALGPVGALGAGALVLGNIMGSGSRDLQLVRYNEEKLTKDERDARRAAGLEQVSAQNYARSGYAQASGDNFFFRNVEAAKPKPIATTGAATYLGTQATVPTISLDTPAAAVVNPAAIPFNPFDPEARRALILGGTPKPVPISTSTAPKTTAGGGV